MMRAESRAFAAYVRLIVFLSVGAFVPIPCFAQPARPNPPRTLADLVDPPRRPGEFPPPPHIDDAKATAAGLRKLAGKQITLYTDLPAAADIDELPRVFDEAIPQWSAYFGGDAVRVARWRMVGYIVKDKAKFTQAGLLPDDLPPFLNGFQRGAEFWLYDQPSAYYRRHLMLHEGTHAFMSHFLGGGGPPWYSEGCAELMGTHRLQDGKLTLNVMPVSREETPYWGRIKIIRDEYAAGRGMLLTDVMKYDAHAHLKNEPYGWSWGAAYFCDRHPLTQEAFRALRNDASDRTVDFSQRFLEAIKKDRQAVAEDWSLFVAECDYGYDVARSAVVRRPIAPLPAAGTKVTIAADRGWQSSGIALEAGKRYQFAAKGRYQIGTDPKPWPCEAEGVTIRYHQGEPLGRLLAAVGDLAEPTAVSPLTRWTALGSRGELNPPVNGTLFLRINEASSGLQDNQGTLDVHIRIAP